MQVAWGLIALQGAAVIACGFLQWHAEGSAKSSFVGIFTLLAALCLVVTVIAAALREVRQGDTSNRVLSRAGSWGLSSSPTFCVQVPVITGNIVGQLPEMFTEIAPQVLPRVLPAMLPSIFGQLLPQLMVVLNGQLPQLLPKILPKILPEILPEVIDSSPQILTKILEELPSILANVSSSAVNRTVAAAVSQPSSPAAASANLPPVGDVVAGILGALPAGRRLQQAAQPDLTQLEDLLDDITLPPLSLAPADLSLPPLPNLPPLPQPGTALPSLPAHPDLPPLPAMSDVIDQLLGLLPSSGRRLLQAEDPQLATHGLLRAIGNGKTTVMMVGFALLAVADFALLILLGINFKQVSK